MKFASISIAAVAILAEASNAERANVQKRLRALADGAGFPSLSMKTEAIVAEAPDSASPPVMGDTPPSLMSKASKATAKSGKSGVLEVETSPPSPNICEDRGGDFIQALEDATGIPDPITCQTAIDGTIAPGNSVNGSTFPRPQTGGDVSCGAKGELNMTGIAEPLTTPLGKTNLCVTNVHFHVGAEHNSDGEYDTNFSATNGPDYGPEGPPGVGADFTGKRCKFFEEKDENKLNFDQYDFKYCEGVKVGETYEMHWPRSTQAACGESDDQYQTPFIDGLLCAPDDPDFSNLFGVLTSDNGNQNLADNVAVQAQVFTVVNEPDDENNYYYPNLIDGMLVDRDSNIGVHITAYTGSRTGGGFNDQPDELRCDPISPVTWQVDRKCQLISAKSLDKMCYDIKTKPGMRQCGIKNGEPCNPNRFVGHTFVVDDERDGNYGETCCFPDTTPGTSRGVNNPKQVADNQVDIGNTCE